MALDVEKRHMNMLCEIFERCCPKAEVLAYGSRVKGEAHSGSDLDLAIKNLYGASISEVQEALRESDIPFIVEAREFERLPMSFQKEIERCNIVIFPKSN